MLSSMQPKFKSRRVSSIRDFPEGFNLIPKAEQHEIQDCLYLAGNDDYAYPFTPDVKILNQDSKFPSAVAAVKVGEEDSFANDYNFVGKMEMNSNVEDIIHSSMPSKPLPKQRRVSAVRDFPRFCGRGFEDEDGDMLLADNSFNSQSKILGGNQIKMWCSREKKNKGHKGANLLQATVRSNKMYCPQGKQTSESEKRVIVLALMAAGCIKISGKKLGKVRGSNTREISNKMYCPQGKQSSESEKRVIVLALMAASRFP